MYWHLDPLEIVTLFWPPNRSLYQSSGTRISATQVQHTYVFWPITALTFHHNLLYGHTPCMHVNPAPMARSSALQWFLPPTRLLSYQALAFILILVLSAHHLLILVSLRATTSSSYAPRHDIHRFFVKHPNLLQLSSLNCS
jgi:hypothetical protein